jgi:hypothetical protein
MTVALGAFTTVGGLVTALLAGAVLGVAAGVFGTTANGLVMVATPSTAIGRVMALNALVLEGVVPVSLSLSGLLATATTPSVTFGAGAVIMAIAVAVAATRRPLRAAQL